MGGQNTVLMQGCRTARTANRYFGKAPGQPHSHTRPHVRSKGRKFERAAASRFKSVTPRFNTANLALFLLNLFHCAVSRHLFCAITGLFSCDTPAFDFKKLKPFDDMSFRAS